MLVRVNNYDSSLEQDKGRGGILLQTRGQILSEIFRSRWLFICINRRVIDTEPPRSLKGFDVLFKYRRSGICCVRDVQDKQQQLWEWTPSEQRHVLGFTPVKLWGRFQRPVTEITNVSIHFFQGLESGTKFQRLRLHLSLQCVKKH